VVNKVDHETASKIVWLDSWITNVDRTARNTNMLVWHDELWLIDHGASLYFQHALTNAKEQAKKPFAAIKDHVLLPYATKLDEVNAKYAATITHEDIDAIAEVIPVDWLNEIFPEMATAEDKRQVYKDFLQTRLDHSDSFTQEAKNARETLI
jgi:hypothetical protein